MNSFAAFLKSSEVSTLFGMYMPAMEGDDAPCFIDNSRSDAWFRPAPIFLVWSTSVCTPAASRALPSASWLAPLCTREISDWMPAAPPPVAARRLLIAVSNWPLKLSTADSTFGTAGADEAPAGTTCASSERPTLHNGLAVHCGPFNAACTWPNIPVACVTVDAAEFAIPRIELTRLAAAPS